MRAKIWPTFEREAFIDRVPNGEVIPIFLDDTKFVGLSRDTIGFVVSPKLDPEGQDFSERVSKEICMKLIERLG